MSELDKLQVYGDSPVGWCAATKPNERVDEYGAPLEGERAQRGLDPRAPARRVYDHPEVQALRAHLKAHNGIQQLEILKPHEIDRAADIFFRDGFVVVADLLDPDALAQFREGSARVLKQILEVPGVGGRKYLTETGRLPHRYSYGTASASRQLLHDPVWAGMVDLATTTPILTRIFGGGDYAVMGAGGDLCLPGAIEYQELHADVREPNAFPQSRLDQARRLGIELRAPMEEDHRGRQLILERTPPMVTINFLTCDLTWENGPIRQIAGTQGRPGRPPSPADEPEWMRLSTLVGAPAGAGIFRDNRAWHGATPNLSREIRAMPNVEYGAPWLDETWYKPTMPHEIWEALSPHAQRICRQIKSEPGVWPAGAGLMHPLAARRADLATAT